MSKFLSIVFLSMAFESASAAVELMQSAIVCGTVDEINTLLKMKMDRSTNLGIGADAQGEKVAALFTNGKPWNIKWLNLRSPFINTHNCPFSNLIAPS